MGLLQPPTCSAILTYNATKAINAAIGAQPMWWQFRGNSCYDPDAAVGGNVAYGFNNYCYVDQVTGSSTGLYNQYRVRASSVTVSFINAGTVPCYFIVLPDEVSYNAATVLPQNITGRRFAKYQFVGGSAGAQKSVIRSYNSTKRVLGLTKAQSDMDTYAALYNTNPTNQWYWNIGFYSADAATALNGYMQVRMKIYVEFFDPIDLA